MITATVTVAVVATASTQPMLQPPISNVCRPPPPPSDPLAAPLTTNRGRGFARVRGRDLGRRDPWSLPCGGGGAAGFVAVVVMVVIVAARGGLLLCWL